MIVFEPDVILRDALEDLHYLPKEWEKAGFHSNYVRTEFSQLFNMRIILAIHEILAVIFTPFVLWFSLPQCAPKIVDFFREFTVHVDGVGWVCSFAVFDFKSDKNVAKIDVSAEQGPSLLDLVPRNHPSTVTSVTFTDHRPFLHAHNVTDSNKMEKSVINFKLQNPDW